MTTCRECGHQVPAGAAFCEICGVPAAITCPVCSAQQPGFARFCSKCGAPIPLEPPPAATAPARQVTAAPPGAPVTPGRPTKSRSLWWIILVVVVIAAAAAVSAYLLTRDRDAGDSQAGQTQQVQAGAGDGWVTQWSAATTNLIDVSFADSQHGWAVGGTDDGGLGIILATQDGGVTWEIQNAGGGFGALFAVCAVDSQTCWAAGYDDTILMTSNGGDTWSSQGSLGIGALMDIAFPDVSRGWCVGSMNSMGTGVCFTTNDGGESWHEVSAGQLGHPGEQRWSLQGVSFCDPDHGWIAATLSALENEADSGVILRTTDGGSTWSDCFSLMACRMYTVGFVDPMNGWACGQRWDGDGSLQAGIWTTSDGGDNWAFHALGTGEDAFSATFVDARNGWAVGDGIYCTTDGGQTWKQQLLGGGPYLNSVAFTDVTTGVAVGINGTVAATTDGGAGDGTLQSWDDTYPAAPSRDEDEMLAYLKRLEQLIKQSRQGRHMLVNAIAAKDSTGLEAVIRNRTSVLDQTRGIAVPDDAAARRCSAALIASMAASIEADERYLAWAKDRGIQSAAAPFDRRAGSAKKRFVRAYNALADQYTMRSNWRVEDL